MAFVTEGSHEVSFLKSLIGILPPRSPPRRPPAGPLSFEIHTPFDIEYRVESSALTKRTVQLEVLINPKEVNSRIRRRIRVLSYYKHKLQFISYQIHCNNTQIIKNYETIKIINSITATTINYSGCIHPYQTLHYNQAIVIYNQQ